VHLVENADLVLEREEKRAQGGRKRASTPAPSERFAEILRS
jgi:hypothetical protein